MKGHEWKALIADDEPAARRGVRQLLAAFPEFSVAGECRNGAEVLNALDVCAADVIFLDIQMPGLDGFEVIRRRTAERMPAVIFLTAFDQYAIKAFEAEALDYLVKPVSEARFAAAMKRLITRLRGRDYFTPDERIVVTTTRGATVLYASEVDWVEAAGNYVQLWIGKRSYFLRESLQLIEERWQPQGFCRAHRSALVRLEGVRRLDRTDGGLVALLTNGARIPISRRRRATFAAALKGAARSGRNR